MYLKITLSTMFMVFLLLVFGCGKKGDDNGTAIVTGGGITTSTSGKVVMVFPKGNNFDSPPRYLAPTPDQASASAAFKKSDIKVLPENTKIQSNKNKLILTNDNKIPYNLVTISKCFQLLIPVKINETTTVEIRIFDNNAKSVTYDVFQPDINCDKCTKKTMKSTAGDLNKDEICFKLTIDGQSIGDEITSIDQAISAVAVINKAHGETVALVNTPTVESEDEAGGGVLLNQHLKYKIQAPISHAAIAVAPWQSIIFG